MASSSFCNPDGVDVFSNDVDLSWIKHQRNSIHSRVGIFGWIRKESYWGYSVSTIRAERWFIDSRFGWSAQVG